MLYSQLLAWYDEHQRVFPWRSRRPNPYHVWLSEVMLQQTTTMTVAPYFRNFIQRWPNVQDLAAADLNEVLHAWAGLGYYSRARSLHKAAQILQDGFPDCEQQLLKLPGVGPYTAAAIAAIAYDQPTTPVDGNIARIFSRLYRIEQPKPTLYDKTRELLGQQIPQKRNGDFVQALMDLGATICTPKNPDCQRCPIQKKCQAYAAGQQSAYPVVPPKKQRPTRYGIAYWIENDTGEILIHQRPEKGLLGGMMGFPTSEWSTSFNRPDQKIGTVEHTFTHFHLVLDVCKRSDLIPPTNSLWVRPERLHEHALPTLMKKVVKVGMS